MVRQGRRERTEQSRMDRKRRRKMRDNKSVIEKEGRKAEKGKNEMGGSHLGCGRFYDWVHGPCTCQSYSFRGATAEGDVGAGVGVGTGVESDAWVGPWTLAGVSMDGFDGVSSLSLSLSLSLSVRVGVVAVVAAAVLSAACAVAVRRVAGSSVGNGEAVGSGSEGLTPSAVAMATVFPLISTNSCFDKPSFTDFNSAESSLCRSLARTFLTLAVEASPPAIIMIKR